MPPLIPTLVCFDESGHLKDPAGITVFAGLLLLPSDPLHGRWQGRLRVDGLPYTSMKEAMRLDGVFYGWRPPRGQDVTVCPRRDALMRDLATIIIEQKALRLHASVKSAD